MSFLVFAEEERASCFPLNVFLLSCGCLCSVSLLHGGVSWFVICGCGISKTSEYDQEMPQS